MIDKNARLPAAFERKCPANKKYVTGHRNIRRSSFADKLSSDVNAFFEWDGTNIPIPAHGFPGHIINEYCSI